MRKVLLAVVCLCALLAACSKATDTVIPSDMSTWDKELAPVVQKLKDEDKALFVSYVTRMKLAEAFGKDKAAIPFGTTVGQAIEEQRKWQVEYAKAQAQEKAEQERQAAEALALKKKMDAERVVALKQINDAVTVALLSKRELGKNYDLGRFSDVQEFVIGTENRSDKDLVGVSGTLDFIDVFGKVVGSVNFGISERIKPGATYKWTGTRDYNQFISEQQAVWNLEEGKYTTRFIPNSLVYADGTKLTLPE